ncbi:MAG: DegT/DnrJ/EryC1/StrS family aminotransferase [Ignavibacteriae bacterium]|nr:DegT/DnrJ/EryC1/StrS family aminotransferase [Ignavibacteriota bacterium]MCB9244019.1 DegT/DnrJ/EryC1/StrS family aminotransferase [Ignavibacteriales bacterium]
MKVPLLDLKAQYSQIKKELDEALIRVAESQYFILGPEVEKLEKTMNEYIGCTSSIGVSSGTDALLVALMAIDIQPGDEVILPTYSFFATAGVVSRLNAKPVFCDVDPVTFNIDPSKIEELVTERTKAITPVHLYGQSADMNPIMEIAKKHNLVVIEDAAQSIGTQYKDGRTTGTIGEVGCFSFFPSKNLGGFGDGGLVTAMDAELGEKIRILRVHGGKPKYYHRIIGGNFRLDAIQAAVINVKFPHLDSWSKQRQSNADLYTSLFVDKGLASGEGVVEFSETEKVLIPKAVYRSADIPRYHIYNQYVIRVEDRDGLREHLKQKEIGTEIYYPVPFHLQDCFAYIGNKKGDFPVAEFCAEKSLALPIYPELTNEQIEYTVDSIKEFIDKS